MKLVSRPEYVDRVKPFINKHIIKVFTRQRRVGKSYVMLQLMEYIHHTNARANIVYVNMDLTSMPLCGLIPTSTAISKTSSLRGQ